MDEQQTNNELIDIEQEEEREQLYELTRTLALMDNIDLTGLIVENQDTTNDQPHISAKEFGINIKKEIV